MDETPSNIEPAGDNKKNFATAKSTGRRYCLKKTCVFDNHMFSHPFLFPSVTEIVQVFWMDLCLCLLRNVGLKSCYKACLMILTYIHMVGIKLPFSILV